jgi:uridine phosphorylase
MGMVYYELPLEKMEKWFGFKRDEVPKDFIVECMWPWYRTEDDVRDFLKDAEKLGDKNNIWKGSFSGKEIGFTIVRGPTTTADTLFPLLSMGVKNIYQIGAIGALQENIELLDLIIPSESVKFEGVSDHFLKGDLVKADTSLVELSRKILESKGFKRYHVGRTISINTIFAETKERVTKWNGEGLLGIDLETATIYSLCKVFGARCVAVLRVIDNLVLEGKDLSDVPSELKDEMKIRNLVKDTVLEMVTSRFSG